MYVIVALTKCVSYEKRDRFKSLLAPIGKTTLQNEHDSLAYAWFQSDAENEVPDCYMRGLEVYKHEDALAVTHRASEEYKAMRSVMGPEGITESPTDLRPLKPAGIGYLTCTVKGDDFSTTKPQSQFVVVRRLCPLDNERRVALKELLRRVADQIDTEPALKETVKSFWVLEYGPDLDDDTLVTFERYNDKKTFEQAERALDKPSSKMRPYCSNLETTRWVSAGIGFIRGQETYNYRRDT